MSVMVTGGTGALGTAVCEALLARGRHLHVTYVVEREVERFVAGMGPADGRYVMHKADVTSEDQVEALFAQAEADGTPVDALIHLTGGFQYGPIESTTLEVFENQMSINLRSTFLCVRAAIRRMKPRGAGRIVAVGSKTAREPAANLSAYVASKAGVLAMVQGLAEELRGTGVGVYAVMPGLIDTPANRASGLDPSKMVPPSDIAAVIATLLEAPLAIATGALIPVYGQ
jgi:NAD(P)-dependent dehydrogenase (short-subunit alcohol dehydrogenase family)